MFQEKWIDLKRGLCSNHYNLKINSIYDNGHCPATINFSQCTFDTNDEALVVIDTNGVAYYIDLSNIPAYKKLGCVGFSSCLRFNPTDKSELLIGLNSTKIKVMRINAINEFCLLTGHTAPPANISFFRDYCLTSSNKEVIIWQKKSYCKAHQLRLDSQDIVIKKAVFSNSGVIAVLYQKNIIQTWIFPQFDKDDRIDLQNYGMRLIRDFDFTKDGRAMIVCGLQNKILIFSTTTWTLLKDINFYENFTGAKQLSVVPLPFDGGANSIIAVLTSDCTLKFISLATSNIIQSCCQSVGIKKLVVSHKGQYLAHINKYGFLDIMSTDKIVNVKLSSKCEKPKENKQLYYNKLQDHLKCVRNAMKEELKLERLMPILNEFGEYPEKYRSLIWETIMKLPNNRKAYIELSSKVVHKGVLELLKNNFLLEKYKLSHLGITLSCLLYWSPILQECTFLPKLILPFVNLFQKNPILGFEASLFILLNYCQKWFEYHPFPPLNILGIIENILLEADPLLFNFFCEKGVTSFEYAWPLLQTMLSEVLSENNWLILWDHLISLQKPWFPLMCTVAYNISYSKIITTKLKTLDDFQQFYRTEGHISVKNILKLAQKLDDETPYEIHPRRYLESNMNTLPKIGPYAPCLQIEFPKYLTDELRGINFKKLKDKERRLRGFRLHAMEILEEKRLQTQTKHFMKDIHELRLNELRKCYENQLHDDERLLEYAREKTKNLNPDKYLNNQIKWRDLQSSHQTCNCIIDSEMKHKNYKLLEEQVQRLECEVQTLLSRLHNNSYKK